MDEIFYVRVTQEKRSTQRTLVPDRYENVLRYAHTKIQGGFKEKKVSYI